MNEKSPGHVSAPLTIFGENFYPDKLNSQTECPVRKLQFTPSGLADLHFNPKAPSPFLLFIREFKIHSASSRK